MENLLAAGLSCACHDARVVSEEPGRVVTHYTRVLSVDGTPLSEVEAENEIAFEGDLICRMTIRERAGPAEARVVWAPLGSRPSVAGEIAARWSGEKLLARLDDGRAIELPTPASADGRWVGDPVIVFFDGQAPLGWYLPSCQFGVDLRGLDDR